eukprot:TRINITY_DN13800_c0_g1_i1.p1 TRINITY_DN13800_c0_g1~~TRINITY_DN13800_c0_g1_i1.p1  ORF type:complete len:172 (+),score=6.25 TRINITY_DN13800_c0_g1_i1:2-517(+)
MCISFFFQAEDGIRDRSPSRGLGDVYKRQEWLEPWGRRFRVYDPSIDRYTNIDLTGLAEKRSICVCFGVRTTCEEGDIDIYSAHEVKRISYVHPKQLISKRIDHSLLRVSYVTKAGSKYVLQEEMFERTAGFMRILDGELIRKNRFQDSCLLQLSWTGSCPVSWEEPFVPW